MRVCVCVCVRGRSVNVVHVRLRFRHAQHETKYWLINSGGGGGGMPVFYQIRKYLKGYVKVSTESQAETRLQICSCFQRETGTRCSSVVRAFAHDAMGRRIDPSWWTR